MSSASSEHDPEIHQVRLQSSLTNFIDENSEMKSKFLHFFAVSMKIVNDDFSETKTSGACGPD